MKLSNDSRQAMQVNSEIRKAALVGDYLPRKCGIATFTHDLWTTLDQQYRDTESFVVPVNCQKTVKQPMQSLGGFDLPCQRVRNEAEGSPSLILLAKS